MYFCARCVLPEKDLQNSCPKCILTHLQIKLKEDTAIEWNLRGGIPEGITHEQIQDKHLKISQLLEANHDEIDPEWPLEVSKLAKIILSERAHHKFTREWNHFKEMEALKNKSKR